MEYLDSHPGAFRVTVQVAAPGVILGFALANHHHGRLCPVILRLGFLMLSYNHKYPSMELVTG
jgi:hypothetical protein